MNDHGTRSRYKGGCTCPPCRAANAAYNRDYRARRAAQRRTWVPRIGTVRRLQALTAAGWSLSAIADHAHVHLNAVWCLLNDDTETGQILAATAKHYARVYDELWWREPPGRYQKMTVRRAERNGWAEPWQWDGIDIDDPTAQPRTLADEPDEIAVELLMSGDRVTTTRRERWEAIRRLRDRGLTASEIGQRIGMSRDAVQQVISRHIKPQEHVA